MGLMKAEWIRTVQCAIFTHTRRIRREESLQFVTYALLALSR
jgi:hypothetical protein